MVDLTTSHDERLNSLNWSWRESLNPSNHHSSNFSATSSSVQPVFFNKNQDWYANQVPHRSFHRMNELEFRSCNWGAVLGVLIWNTSRVQGVSISFASPSNKKILITSFSALLVQSLQDPAANLPDSKAIDKEEVTICLTLQILLWRITLNAGLGGPAQMKRYIGKRILTNVTLVTFILTSSNLCTSAPIKWHLRILANQIKIKWFDSPWQ